MHLMPPPVTGRHPYRRDTNRLLVNDWRPAAAAAAAAVAGVDARVEKSSGSSIRHWQRRHVHTHDDACDCEMVAHWHCITGHVVMSVSPVTEPPSPTTLVNQWQSVSPPLNLVCMLSTPAAVAAPPPSLPTHSFSQYWCRSAPPPPHTHTTPSSPAALAHV